MHETASDLLALAGIIRTLVALKLLGVQVVTLEHRVALDLLSRRSVVLSYLLLRMEALQIVIVSIGVSSRTWSGVLQLALVGVSKALVVLAKDALFPIKMSDSFKMTTRVNQLTYCWFPCQGGNPCGFVDKCEILVP